MPNFICPRGLTLKENEKNETKINSNKHSVAQRNTYVQQEESEKVFLFIVQICNKFDF